jgi:hypothetical protein
LEEPFNHEIRIEEILEETEIRIMEIALTTIMVDLNVENRFVMSSASRNEDLRVRDKWDHRLQIYKHLMFMSSGLLRFHQHMMIISVDQYHVTSVILDISEMISSH